MDFTLSDEHEDFRRTLREFFAREAPHVVVAAIDRGERPIEPIFEKMRGLGLWGLSLGERWGGTETDYLAVAIAVEEVSKASASLLHGWVPTLTCSRTLINFGTEQQREEILPLVAEGKLRMGLALTEPSVGSDLTHLSTHAVRDGDDWVITGQKVFATGADTANHMLVFVRTDPDAPPSRGLSVLLVPGGAPGLTVRPLHKLAAQASSTCEMFFEDVRVPADRLVGELGEGLRVVQGLLDYERITNAAQSVGVAQGAFELALSYAKERVQFGKPIIEHQAVGHKLADMQIEIEMARLLTWRAAWKLTNGLQAESDALFAKVAGSECGTRCANRGMQILGGYSYMVDYGMERFWRESKINEIVAGTNEILRNNIAKTLARS